MPPSSVTRLNSFCISRAVSSRIGRDTTSGVNSMTVRPWASTMRWMIVGFIRKPLFATAHSMFSIWMEVTLTPCPIGIREMLIALHFERLCRMPTSSPGSSIPVMRPIPKSRRYFSSRRSPSVRATFAAPILLDFFRMSATDSRPYGW